MQVAVGTPLVKATAANVAKQWGGIPTLVPTSADAVEWAGTKYTPKSIEVR